MRSKIFLLLPGILLFVLPAAATPIKAVCFTPGEDCRSLIVDEINQAKTSIRIQAYSFTCKEIAKALTDAHRRKVDVQVVLDKSQKREKYTSATFLHNAGVPVSIDSRHAIQHNKVIVIDGQTVITGSYNFTNAAAARNAENVLVLDDPATAAKYLGNWQQCAKHSESYERQVSPSSQQ